MLHINSLERLVMTNTSLFVPFISYKENKEMWIWPQVAFFWRNFRVNLHTLWAIYITFYYCKNSISTKCFSLHGTCANLLKNNFYSFSSMVEIKCELQVWTLKEFSIKLEHFFFAVAHMLLLLLLLVLILLLFASF